MVGDGIVMTILFQITIVYLLLLTMTFAVPKLKPLLYTVFFFVTFFIVFTTVIFPFSRTLLTLFEILPNPFASLIIGSAILYTVSELFTTHIAESGYESLAAIAHLSVKIAILLLWMNEIQSVIELLSSLITT